MARRPELIIFDVNGTLSDMTPMAQRFTDVGAPGHLARTWFAQLLRDGFALTAAGTAEMSMGGTRLREGPVVTSDAGLGRSPRMDTATFASIGAGTLRVTLHGVLLDRDLDAAISHIMDGFDHLAVHPDVDGGTRALAGLGIRMATLSNGAAAVAEGLLARAGIRDRFERLLSVEDAGVWKPAAGAYAYGTAICGVEPAATMLVAVHPWDIDGARRAGLSTAWINRTDGPYPPHFLTADLQARSLDHLADLLN